MATASARPEPTSRTATSGAGPPVHRHRGRIEQHPCSAAGRQGPRRFTGGSAGSAAQAASFGSSPGGEARDGVAPAFRREPRPRRPGGDAGRLGRLDRQHLRERRSPVAAVAEALLAAQHGERAAAPDVVAQRSAGTARSRARGRARRRSSRTRTASNVRSCSPKISATGNGMSERSSCEPGWSAFGAQDEEADEVDVRILLQEPAQEADVPARPARHQQHPHAVADDAQHEGARRCSRPPPRPGRPARPP